MKEKTTKVVTGGERVIRVSLHLCNRNHNLRSCFKWSYEIKTIDFVTRHTDWMSKICDSLSCDILSEIV